MSKNTIKYTDFKPENLQFVKNKPAKGAKPSNNIKSYKVSYKVNDKFYNIKFPKVKVPFGIHNTPIEFNPNNDPKYNMSCNLDIADPKYNSNNEINNLIKFHQDTDNAVLNFLATNSEEIFGEVHDVQFILDAKWYTPIIKKYKPKADSNTKYSDSFKLKLQIFKNGGPGFTVFDPLTGQEIKTHSEVVSDDGTPILDVEGKMTYNIDWDTFHRGFDAVPLVNQGVIQVINGKAFFKWTVHAFQKYELEASGKVTNASFITEDELVEQIAKIDIAAVAPEVPYTEEVEVEELVSEDDDE